MKYSLQNPTDVNKAITYFEKLVTDGKNIELKEVRKVRTLSQNKYLHVCITLYAIHFGSCLDEAKTDLKRECDFMRYQNNGNTYLKSTAKLDTKELTDFIEWIRNYASIEGCYIPTSEEYLTQKFEIDREIEINKKYL